MSRSFDDYPVIQLERRELEHAVSGGTQRQLQALLCDASRHFEAGDSWENHVLGAVAEMALARYLDCYWHPVFDDPASVRADLGEKVEVRAGPKRDHELLVREWDREKFDHVYVLVLCHELKPCQLNKELPHFYVAGWATGHEIEARGRLLPADGQKPNAWSLPQDGLAPVVRKQRVTAAA